MADENGSLTFKEQAQLESAPFLFSKQTMEELTKAERRGEYTLERLRELRPEVIDEIIRLRGQWAGKLRIAKIVGVHHKTVAAVDAAYPEEIEDERQRRVHRLRSAADKLIEQIDDSPENVPWNVKGLVASQLLDKAELLDGNATVRTEHNERVDIFAQFQAFTEELKKEAEAMDIARLKDSETGSPRETKSAKSDPSAATAIATLPSPTPALRSENEP
jgi:hypothetical protein